MKIPNEFWFILLGAILSFIGQFIFQLIKNWLDIKAKTQNFILFVKLELELISKTLDKLQTALDYGLYYDYTLLDRVKESISSLEKARSDVIYLTNPELKEKFIDVISDVSTYIIMVRATQEIFYANRNRILETDNPQTETQIPSAKSKTKAKKLTSEKKQLLLPENMEDVWKKFNEQRTDKKIEYIEIKRRLDDLIKAVDFKNH